MKGKGNVYISRRFYIYILSEGFVPISKCKGNIHILRRFHTHFLSVRRIKEGVKDLLWIYTHQILFNILFEAKSLTVLDNLKQ